MEITGIKMFRLVTTLWPISSEKCVKVVTSKETRQTTVSGQHVPQDFLTTGWTNRLSWKELVIVLSTVFGPIKEPLLLIITTPVSSSTTSRSSQLQKMYRVILSNLFSRKAATLPSLIQVSNPFYLETTCSRPICML